MACTEYFILRTEPYMTIGLLILSGGLGGWLRYNFDDIARRRVRPKQLGFILIGSTTACLIFSLSRPLFPSESNPAHYYASLIGVGSLGGFWGIELYIRLVRRLSFTSHSNVCSWDKTQKEMQEEIRELATGPEAREIQKRFPAMVPFYQDLL